MTVRPLVRFPDPRLKTIAAPVIAFDTALAVLADDLLDTMRAAPGIGITAPHIGVPLRLVVLDLPAQEGTDIAGVRIYANPHILWTSDDTARHAEGSVSMPGVVEDVERPARVRIGYQDLSGAPHEEEAKGLLAVCHQHEIDQLDGLFWLHRLSRLKRERVIRRYEKLNGRG